MLVRSKRGETTPGWWVVILVLVSICIAGLFMFVNGVVEDTTFWQKFYSRDMAFAVNAMHSAQGKLMLGYQIGHTQKVFNVKLDGDRVGVGLKAEEEIGSHYLKFFRFPASHYVDIIPDEITPYYFSLERQGEKIYLHLDKEPPKSCPGPTTKDDFKAKKIFVDSKAKGTGVQAMTLKEGDMTSAIVTRTMSSIIGEQTLLNSLPTRPDASTITESNADMILSLHLESGSSNYLRMYYEPNIKLLHAEKLGCHFLYEINQLFPLSFFDGVDHPPTLPPSINRYNIDKPVLYIVMGSIQHYTNNDKQKLLIEKTPIAIKNAVKKYYE